MSSWKWWVGYTIWIGTGSLDPIADLVFVVLVDVVDVDPFPLLTLAEDDAFLFLFFMCSFVNYLIMWEYHPWCRSGHNNASLCVTTSCFLQPFLCWTPLSLYCSCIFWILILTGVPVVPSLITYWAIEHSCFFLVLAPSTSVFLVLPPSIADFIMFFLLPPAVDFSNGGCMKQPCVALDHTDLSGILGTRSSYAALNFWTEK